MRAIRAAGGIRVYMFAPRAMKRAPKYHYHHFQGKNVASHHIIITVHRRHRDGINQHYYHYLHCLIPLRHTLAIVLPLLYRQILSSTLLSPRHIIIPDIIITPSHYYYISLRRWHAQSPCLHVAVYHHQRPSTHRHITIFIFIIIIINVSLLPRIFSLLSLLSMAVIICFMSHRLSIIFINICHTWAIVIVVCFTPHCYHAWEYFSPHDTWRQFHQHAKEFSLIRLFGLRRFSHIFALFGTPLLHTATWI